MARLLLRGGHLDRWEILVITERGEGGGRDSSIYVRNADGSAATLIGEGTAFALSPDGKRVLSRQASDNRERLSLLPTGSGNPVAVKTPGLVGLSVQPNQPVGKRFGIRAAAYWIDFFIINTVLFSVSYGTGLIARGFIYVILHIFHISISVGTLADGWYWVLGIIAPILYFVIFEWLYGASPGKLILGMRVVQEKWRALQLRCRAHPWAVAVG